MTEIWKPVVGYEGLYDVSDQGRVRSLDRVITHVTGRTQFCRGRLLKFNLTTSGYYAVRITKARPRQVHDLVAEAFLGPKPAGYYVCHNDSNKTNNLPGNLRYDTPQSNQYDRRGNGTHHQGSQMPWAKLTEADIPGIRKMLAAGSTCEDIGPSYGVTPGAIRHIMNGRSWVHVL